MFDTGKKIIAILLVLICVAVAGWWFLSDNIYFSGMRPVVLSRQIVDLRGAELTMEAYGELEAKCPGKILWDVPISGSRFDSTSEVITLKKLDREDISKFVYLPNLKLVEAQECQDMKALAMLEEQFPDLTVQWQVHLGGRTWNRDSGTVDLRMSDVTADELMEVLAYFSPGTNVQLAETGFTAQQLQTMRKTYPGLNFFWNMEILGKTWSGMERVISFGEVKPDLQTLLEASEHFSVAEKLDLTGCGFTVQELIEIRNAFGGAHVVSELELYGVQTDTTVEELDLSNIPMESTGELEEALQLLPNLKKVIMIDCGFSNEEMDALNQRHPEVKFVWTVKIGRASVRTDITGFIGRKYGYFPDDTKRHQYDKYHRLTDMDCVNFKYCTDLIALDLTNMAVADYSFLEYMPNLQYLSLADTLGTDFTVLEKLPDLIYLELFVTEFDQTDLLPNLTQLKGLNLSDTAISNMEPLKQMTWLEMLWISKNDLDEETVQSLIAALPDTEINHTARQPAGDGWRKSGLYLDMRKILGL